MIPSPENMLDAAQAMDALIELEQRSTEVSRQLPETEVVRDVWDGLAFTVAGVRLVAALSEVSEMLTHGERITRVPGAKPWMLGLSNVRGSLLPIIDLQVYLGGKAIVPSKATRILVLRLRGLVVGLMVPAVHGMRHFNFSGRLPNARMKGVLGAYVYEAFTHDNEVWPVFSMTALAADPNFRSAAA